MQKYCLAHSSSDPFVGPTVGGRRLSMARLGQQIVDEPIPLAGPPKPCRRRHFAEAERRLQDLSQSPQMGDAGLLLFLPALSRQLTNDRRAGPKRSLLHWSTAEQARTGGGPHRTDGTASAARQGHRSPRGSR